MEDLISELPQGILETILNKLPIRDAVTTCILSRQWRYKWTSLTHLVFNDICVNHHSHDRIINLQGKIANFITRFLFLHNGPIHKFSLSTWLPHNSSDIAQWLLFISRKDVKELILGLTDCKLFRAPSCIFSCEKLASLELDLEKCELKLPINFKGFLCLKHLTLVNLSISSHDRECLISTCPLLESLTLEFCNASELTIRAPNLKYLTLYGEFKNLCLANSPLLVYISINISDLDYGLKDHVNQSSRLIGSSCSEYYFSIGYHNRHYLNPNTYHYLKSIELDEVKFDDLGQVRVVLQLIASAPNLQDLQISGYPDITSTPAGEPDMDNWTCICTLHKLKSVKIYGVLGVPYEMKLIEYLLKYSPSLETMSITLEYDANVAERRLNVATNLLSFHRASPRASIVFTR